MNIDPLTFENVPLNINSIYSPQWNKYNKTFNSKSGFDHYVQHHSKRRLPTFVVSAENVLSICPVISCT